MDDATEHGLDSYTRWRNSVNMTLCRSKFQWNSDETSEFAAFEDRLVAVGALAEVVRSSEAAGLVICPSAEARIVTSTRIKRRGTLEKV